MNTPPSTTGVSNRFAPGTLGEHLERTEARFQAGEIDKLRKGDALEKAFLRICKEDPALDFEDARPFPEWARSDDNPQTEESPGFPPQDRGIDLVATRRDGSFVAIQCKFHEKPVSSADVQSFLAEMNPGKGNPEVFAQGWIVSATPLTSGLERDLAAKHRNVQHKSIWDHASFPMKGGAGLPLQKLRPHQEEAVRAVLDKLPRAPRRRGKLIMACGTGKTLVALRAMEKLLDPGETALVAVPTIILASQFRDEWLRQAESPLDSLVVCSDSGAGKPGSAREAESARAARELSAPVTTDPEGIRAFLEAPACGSAADERRRVVFCTYASLGKVAEAMEGSQTTFSLAVVDEAHRTTGAAKANLGAGEKRLAKASMLVHDDARIRACMRLYMTATPRVYGNAKSLAGKGYAVVDMGDEETFGHVLHNYGFARAVKDKVLCDYRVIALGISEDSLTESLRQSLRATALQDVTANEMTRVLGTLVALRGGASSPGGAEDGRPGPGVLHRTIAFANSVARSKWFVGRIEDPDMKRRATELAQRTARGPVPQGLDVRADHADASVPMTARRAKLRALAEASRRNVVRVLSNVGLFSEGVDVPSLNAVAFLDARSSPVEIVQAVGRVMRRPEDPGDKSMGYVIVPTALPPGRSFEEGIRGAEERFQPLLSVISALQSHDEDLDRALESKLLVKAVDPGPPLPPRDPGEPREDSLPTQLEMDLEAKQALLPFVVERTGLTHDRRKADAVDGIERRVRSEAARMAPRMGPALGETLGVSPHPKAGEEGRWREAATLGALMILNGMIVHRRMQGTGVPGSEALRPLSELPGLDDPGAELDAAWSHVLKRDYRPIFEPARKALGVVREHPGLCRDILTGLAETADRWGPEVARIGWDHAGPLYHRVLGTAKSDSAYYTTNVGALMLARLAVGGDMADWSDPSSVAALRIADPACGTGTLLMATLKELKRRALEADPEADMEDLHRKLVERTLCGLDINLHATQLAASNLTMNSERVDYDRMNLKTMPHGRQPDGSVAMGSLELLAARREGEGFGGLFDPERTMTGLNAAAAVREREPKGEEDEREFPLEDLDLVIMNPPFGNATVRDGHKSEEERQAIKAREKEIAEACEARDPRLKDVVDSNSIATYFTPISDVLAHSKKGTIAKVIPTTALIGTAGEPERCYLAKCFHIERIVTNHDPRNFNFSEGTSIHESLIVCRRSDAPEPTEHVSLRRRPMNEAEATECIEAILAGEEAPKWFTRAKIPHQRIATGDWGFAQWHQPDLERIVQELESHAALVPLESVATLGPKMQQAWADWHRCEEGEEPEAHGFWTKSGKVNKSIRSGPEQPLGRKRGGGQAPWTRAEGKASSLLVTMGNNIQSGRLFAIHSPEPSFGLAWQPVLMDKEDQERAIAGWINSTPGRLLLLNRRAKTLSFPIYQNSRLQSLPLPAGEKGLKSLDAATASCQDRVMEQGRDSADCRVRATLDEAAAEVLGLPAETVHGWRRTLAQEPTVSGRMIPVPQEPQQPG